ncbi:CxxxxCH/CxxCH domain-containing protein [Geobacter pelophilus]|uniref:CxxxxCH/CxxCH domain-containing protein n=1 Tax=Geoanaerobacter pelophilus TaxID=60036 RepID=A0AAW4LA86_9BACT|nr:CxxxxCH/CxxCH domain-containing protein [Geoanaerobacter pelophilus]MBT0666515.1 CxxxxCH/CxxCH domain-containing protein [Geoanaerobacter pelophilus]
MRDRLLKTFAGMACSSRKVFQTGFWGVAIAIALSLFSPLVTNADAVSPLIHNSTYGGTGKYGEWGQDYTCATCHTKSATPNIKKVATSVKTPTGMRKVVMSRYTSMSRTVLGRYTAMSTDVVGVLGNDRRTIYQERSQNICEVCHHRTEYHQYSASKIAVKAGGLNHTAHKSNNRDCTGCHAHQNAFKRPAVESCDSCHGNPPTTATIGAPSGLYTNTFGDPPTHSGAHSKHRNVLGFECQVCHNNYGHGLLGNDYVELGFRISSSNWKPFVGEVTTGTITVSNSAGLNTQFSVAPNNPGTTLLRAPDAMNCNIYCHGDNWNVPSGRTGTGVSWIQGPLGACSNAICHGTSAQNPPTPILLGNVSTGAHRTHVSKLNSACTTCHEDLPDPHMVNGRVNLNMTQANANLPAITAQAKYNGFTLYSTHTLAASGSYFSCSNMYCHSNVQGTNGTGAPTAYQGAVKWGGNGSNAYLACDSCHGGKRTDSTPINSGAHNKHIATSYYQYSCDSCHTGAGKNDQSKHANKKIEVTMAGSYSGSYTQTTNVPGDGFGSCSNVNCHYGKSVGWGDGTLNCNSCHGSDSSTLSSGRHAGHISTTANSNLGTAFKCTACHAQVVSSNTTISNYLRHANGFSDYSGRNAGRSYTAVDGTCANVYCHTDGKGRQNVPFTAGNGWNSGTVYSNCNGCHGNDVAPAFTSLGGEPNYANDTETQPRANSHSRHMGGVGVSTCIYCHASTVNSTGAILVNSTSHTNRRIDVQAGAGKNFQYDPATRTCSNILCHGGYSNSARWGKIFPADCTGCHGNNASSFRPLSTGKHTAHINHNVNIWGKNVRCNTCHALTAGLDDRSILDTSLHGNGFKNFTGVMAGGRGAYDISTGVCSANYCHSDGKGKQNVPFTVANAWKSTATLSCTGCHGNDASPDFVSAAGEPNYATGLPGSLRANDHKNHVDFGATTCISCHADTVNGTGVILANASTHVNKRIDIKPGNGKNFIYDAGLKSCTNITCHGGVGSPTQIWGTPVSADCTGCHGNNAGSSNAIATNKHTAHIKNPDIGGNFKCAECHGQTINPDDRTFFNRQLHGNGILNYSGARAGRSYDSAQGNCANTYCHTDGKGSQNTAFSLGNGWKSAVTYSNCIGCHGNAASPAFTSNYGEPNYTNAEELSLRANSHERHMGGAGATTCVYCHNSTVDASGALLSGASHLNRTRDVAPGGDKSFAYDQATRTCSNINCHGTGSVPARWGKIFPLDCTGCHGNNALAQKQISTGKHKAHINNKSILGKNFSCDTCHALTAGSNDRSILNTVVHGNGFKNVTGVMSGGRNTYTTATGVCSATYCHTDGKGKRNAPFTPANAWKSTATLGCTGCHGNDTSPDFTSVNGEPNYLSGGAGTVYANDHKNHVDFGAATCIDCHNDTVDAAGNLKQDVNSHLNRSIDVVSGNGKTFDYDKPSKTCSNIYCHGGKGSYSQVWGTPVSTTCTGCHGNNVASLQPISSGRHKAHINNAATLGINYLCADCHALTVNSDDRTFANRQLHGNGLVNYSGAKAGRSYDNLAGNCANTYCHTSGKGKRNVSFTLANGWKSTTVYTNCIGCHGNDNLLGHYSSVAGEPNYKSGAQGSYSANSHKKHVGAAGATTCYYCHADVVGVTGATVNVSHINRQISYSSSNIAGKKFGRVAGKTCSNIECHFNKSAVWGAVLNCNSCHGSDAATLTTKKHSVHISTTINPALGNAIACVECHAKTVNSDNVTIRNSAVHIDGVMGNYSGAKAGRYTAATGACANAYCHSDGKGKYNVVFNAGNGWNSSLASRGCKGCHGNDTVLNNFSSLAGEPNYPNTGAIGSATSNSHKSHTSKLALKGAASCDTCHTDTVTASGTAIKPGAPHLTAPANLVSFNTSKAGAGSAYDKDLRQCSNISCHAGKSPIWGDASSVGCDSCHGSSEETLTTKKHSAHISTIANASLGTAINCSECHAKTVDINKSVISDPTHTNGIYGDYSGTRAGRYTIATGACANSYCHSDGKGRQNVPFNAGNGWNSSVVFGDCKGCHGNDTQPGNFTSTAGEPNYANSGLPGSATANSHNSHVSYYGGAASCDYCHTNTVTTNGLSAKPGGSHLANGINVDFNRSIEATASWNGTSRTCSTITCHSGSGATWGDASSVGCKVCHGTLLTKPGVHATHVGNLLDSITFYGYTAIKSSNGVYRIGCANCHPTIESGNHKNGKIDVTMNKNQTGRSWLAGLNSATADGINTANSGISGTTKVSVTCSMVYCHSSGKSTVQAENNFKTTPDWYSAAGSTANRCGMCHDNPPQYDGQSHYVAESSMGKNGTGPYKDSGHMVGIHFKNTYKGPGGYGFLGYSSAGDKAHGNAGVASTMSCDTCHSGVVDPAKPDTYAMFGSGKKFECASCHTATTPTKLQAGNIVGTGLHINGKKDVQFTTSAYKTKAQLANVANAGGVWMRNGGYKEAGSYDSTDLSGSTWDSATKTCLTACHVNQPAIRWGYPLKCSSCHANQ